MTREQQLTREIGAMFGPGHQDQFTKRIIMNVLDKAGVEELEKAKEIIINYNKLNNKYET